MRRPALLCCAIATSGFLAGCTGTGVFLDHTFSFFGENPNAPAGNSEMFLRLRGEPVSIVPLVPETGDVWPGPQKPDPTLQELEQQQQAPGAAAAVGPEDRRQPHAPGTAPAAVQPGAAPNLIAPPQKTQSGTALDVTGGQPVPGYRNLQPTARER